MSQQRFLCRHWFERTEEFFKQIFYCINQLEAMETAGKLDLEWEWEKACDQQISFIIPGGQGVWEA